MKLKSFKDKLDFEWKLNAMNNEYRLVLKLQLEPRWH